MNNRRILMIRSSSIPCSAPLPRIAERPMPAPWFVGSVRGVIFWRFISSFHFPNKVLPMERTGRKSSDASNRIFNCLRIGARDPSKNGKARKECFGGRKNHKVSSLNSLGNRPAAILSALEFAEKVLSYFLCDFGFFASLFFLGLARTRELGANRFPKRVKNSSRSIARNVMA